MLDTRMNVRRRLRKMEIKERFSGGGCDEVVQRQDDPTAEIADLAAVLHSEGTFVLKSQAS